MYSFVIVLLFFIREGIFREGVVNGGEVPGGEAPGGESAGELTGGEVFGHHLISLQPLLHMMQHVASWVAPFIQAISLVSFC